MKIKNLEIREIGATEGDELFKLLTSDDKSYSKYFIPFPFELEVIKNILREKKQDKFFGIFEESKLIGFYMLRGFDEGFNVPSYGVWISKSYSNKGLSTLTLYHAFAFCRLNNISKLMLKVHPQNTVAKNIYEKLGFREQGLDQKNNNLIYYKDIK